MLYNSVLRALSAALVLTSAHGREVNQRRQTSIDQFIKSQSDVSVNGVLANIGPDGSKAQGASAGLIVASPSRSDPDCKYRSQHDEPLCG
jgi:glucoamylase